LIILDLINKNPKHIYEKRLKTTYMKDKRESKSIIKLKKKSTRKFVTKE